MKRMDRIGLILIISLTAFVAEGMAQKITIDPGEVEHWPALKDVTFGATIKGVDEITGRKVEMPSELWRGFVIFSCKSSKTLGGRLLWVDAEVTFSNGMVREFKGIDFFLLNKGEEFDIKKIPFENRAPVSVSEVKVKNVVFK